MKKITFILCTSFAVAGTLHAQTFAEWFSQKKTQIKYLINQIAACQVYAGYLEKGYDIAQKGLATIYDIKKGEFDLHTAFFSSLKSVNPKIKSYSKVADIISYESAIIKEFKQIQKFNDSYFNGVYSNMARECDQSLDELINVITDDRFEMTDDERIKRIDTIWLDMKDKYAFTKAFTSEANLFFAQKQFESNETDFGYRIFGLQH